MEVSNILLFCCMLAVSCQRAYQGVAWKPSLVEAVPTVFTSETDRLFIEKVHKLKVVDIRDGCSVYEKRLLVLEDGTKVCCKHRVNYQQMQGELYSFHLSRLLNIYNVPPTALVKVDFGSAKWKNIAGEVNRAGLKHGMVIVLTQYIEHLQQSYIPQLLNPNSNLILPANLSLEYISVQTLHRLIQWSNLVVFDYLTANSDRVMNALANLQWNPKVINLPVHNLEETPEGTIVFIDNESGFWLGYKLASESDNYSRLQKSYITKVCIVDGNVLEAMRTLLDKGGRELHKRVVEHDPISCQLIPMVHEYILDELENRLALAIKSINSCSKSG